MIKSKKVSSVKSKDQIKRAVKISNERVRKSNEAFDNLTPAEKRMFIARDVLQQLAAKKIVAQQLTWISDAKSRSYLLSDKAIVHDQELKEVFDSMSTCHACALGSLFFCAVKTNDRLKISELEHVKTKTHKTKKQLRNGYDYDDELDPNSTELGKIYLNDIETYLGQFFSKNQLKLIELAFESGRGAYQLEELNSHNEAEEFFDLGIGEENNIVEISSYDRMRLIMENIIANKGTFVPSKKPKIQTLLSTDRFVG